MGTRPEHDRTRVHCIAEWISARANPFRDAVNPGAVVFWPGPHGRVWLVMGTPTWFSVDQGAGIVFSRDTAIEYDRRKIASRALRSSIESCASVASSECHIEARAVRALCGQREGPDYVVLNARIAADQVTDWPMPP